MVNEYGEDVFLDDLVPAIMTADSIDLEDILEQVKRRYVQLFPQWEMHIISLKKDEDRIRQIDAMIAMLERLKSEE